MEFFILALIGKVGLISLYELRQRAFLETGGIRSAMNTLENEQLISRAEQGKRHRKDLALTAAGSELLHQSWQACLREYPDADAVLRAAFVAWVMASPVVAAEYLDHIGQSRRGRAQAMKREEEHLNNYQSGPLSGYAWMRISHEVHRRSAESEAFLSMSELIKERFEKDASHDECC